MKDIMVSVRIPNSLVLELKKLARDKHFMDLSEEIRSIIRQNWLSNADLKIIEPVGLDKTKTEVGK